MPTLRSFLPTQGPQKYWSARIGICILLLVGSSIVWGIARARTAPAGDGASEIAALKTLNDSDWARTVTPSLQDEPCGYRNPAFPGLSPSWTASSDPPPATEPVKPDRSDYLVRFQSAKPVQAAAQQLTTTGKWSDYSSQRALDANDGPTDLATGNYNVADMITIALILKHPDPENPNFFNYAFEQDGRAFPARGFQVWPCSAIKTSNGQTFARITPSVFHLHAPFAIQFSFPRVIDGKPLIAGPREKVEFRLVAQQRVFEATFYINAADALDGSESRLFLPNGFTDPIELVRQ